MCNFIVLILTCDWLISKFFLFFFLGGLGSCSHTVNALQIKTIGGGATGGHLLDFFMDRSFIEVENSLLIVIW